MSSLQKLMGLNDLEAVSLVPVGRRHCYPAGLSSVYVPKVSGPNRILSMSFYMGARFLGVSSFKVHGLIRQ